MTYITFNLVVIRSAEIEHSLQFYTWLGLAFTQHRHGNGPEHYACELGTVVFELYPLTNEAQNTKATRIGFQVDELDALIARLQENGVTIISQPKDSPWGRRAIVDDPDGHRVELLETSKSS
jgi:lactoylglutathione lyase